MQNCQPTAERQNLKEIYLIDWHKDFNQELPSPRDFSELWGEVALPVCDSAAAFLK